jgi:hypothetical protein
MMAIMRIEFYIFSEEEFQSLFRYLRKHRYVQSVSQWVMRLGATGGSRYYLTMTTNDEMHAIKQAVISIVEGWLRKHDFAEDVGIFEAAPRVFALRRKSDVATHEFDIAL